MNERHHHLEPKSYTPPMYIALQLIIKTTPKDISGYLKLLSSCSYHASRNQEWDDSSKVSGPNNEW
jgi:hypothetical protein